MGIKSSVHLLCFGLGSEGTKKCLSAGMFGQMAGFVVFCAPNLDLLCIRLFLLIRTVRPVPANVA